MDLKFNERWSEINDLLKKVSQDADQRETALNNVMKSKEKLNTDLTNLKSSQKNKLKNDNIKLCKSAITSLDAETKTLRELLDVIADINDTLYLYQKKFFSTSNVNQLSGGVRRGTLMKILQQTASNLPLFIPNKLHEPAPPLCGCIPADQAYVAKNGDQVAAFVPSPDGDGSKVWVLGEVLQYSGAGKYEIDDIDEENKERHTIGRRRVIPLPKMRANPATNPEALFQKDVSVLALYPQTTCFYKALVNQPPTESKEPYLIMFEDATYSEGYSPPMAVPQRYVIASRDTRK